MQRELEAKVAEKETEKIEAEKAPLKK